MIDIIYVIQTVQNEVNTQMIIYSIIMFAAAITLAVFGILISKGHTNVINCYREEKVSNKELYCKKFSQALYFFASTIMCSGIIGLLGETDVIALVAVGVLVVGGITGMIRLFSVQKKYGGGVF